MTVLSDQLHLHPDQLGAYWMPFTANRQFKAAPRMIAKAEGMYYWTADGRKVLDGFAGLWCCNAGHCRKPIVEAIQKQAATLDYSPAFQMAHPLAFELANRIVEIAPADDEPRLLYATRAPRRSTRRSRSRSPTTACRAKARARA